MEEKIAKIAKGKLGHLTSMEKDFLFDHFLFLSGRQPQFDLHLEMSYVEKLQIA